MTIYTTDLHAYT